MTCKSVSDLSSPIGILAGNGAMPLEIAANAKKLGLALMAVSHIGETSKELEQLAAECLWIKVGQLGRILKFFRKQAVKQVVMAGGISRLKLFGARPDLAGFRLLARIKSVRDDVILRGVAEEIEKAGIEVIAPSLLLSESVARFGLLTTRDFSAAELGDAALGWEAAKQIGLLDIGQTVVVMDGLVVAVEAVEGTDAAIRRAGELARRGIRKKDGWLQGAHGPVVVKVCKPQQDLRLDLPTIGVATIKTMAEAGARGIVLEAEKTIIMDPAITIAEANRQGIAIKVVQSLSDLK